MNATQRAERDRVLNEAVRAGKFSEARKAVYEEHWARDPEGTRKVVESLACGLRPDERDSLSGGTASSASASGDYPREWFPETRKLSAPQARASTGDYPDNWFPEVRGSREFLTKADD